MDELEAIRLYVEENWTLRRIAKQMNTNHHLIERILQRNGIETGDRAKRRAPFTEEHKSKIGAKSKGRQSTLGRKMSVESRRKNMRAKMQTDLTLDEYVDFDRLLLLTGILTRHKKHLAVTDEQRTAFLDTFYFDDAFNAVYDVWIASGKNKWCYPSIDHKTPKANGGNWTLDNLQFITWFENRAKADMTLAEWDAFKQSTNTRSDLFIEAILENLDTRGN